jgi:hypothetical protein
VSQVLEDEQLVLDALDFDVESCVLCDSVAEWAAECTNPECSQRPVFCEAHRQLIVLGQVTAVLVVCRTCHKAARPADAIRWVKL